MNDNKETRLHPDFIIFWSKTKSLLCINKVAVKILFSFFTFVHCQVKFPTSRVNTKTSFVQDY